MSEVRPVAPEPGESPERNALPSGSRVAWRMLWLLLAALVVCVDQLSKAWIASWLQYNQPLDVLPVLDFRLLYNSGAAFGFLSDASGWQRHFLSGFAGIAIVVLTFWLLRLPARQQSLLACALALIAGGAMGNLWDRLQLGYVVDFISVHWGSHYFPAFNVADSAITVGAGLMLLDIWRSREAPTP